MTTLTMLGQRLTTALKLPWSDVHHLRVRYRDRDGRAVYGGACRDMWEDWPGVEVVPLYGAGERICKHCLREARRGN